MSNRHTGLKYIFPEVYYYKHRVLFLICIVVLPIILTVFTRNVIVSYVVSGLLTLIVFFILDRKSKPFLEGMGLESGLRYLMSEKKYFDPKLRMYSRGLDMFYGKIINRLFGKIINRLNRKIISGLKGEKGFELEEAELDSRQYKKLLSEVRSYFSDENIAEIKKRLSEIRELIFLVEENILENYNEGSLAKLEDIKEILERTADSIKLIFDVTEDK